MKTKIQTLNQQMLEESKKRRALALAMRDQKKTMEEIGAALGVSHQRASQLIRQARKEAGRA